MLPLCYLLKAWPIAPASGSAVCRLYTMFDELLNSQAAGLLDSERKIIDRILRDKCTFVEGLPTDVANAMCDVCSNRRYEVSVFDGSVV